MLWPNEATPKERVRPAADVRVSEKLSRAYLQGPAAPRFRGQLRMSRALNNMLALD